MNSSSINDQLIVLFESTRYVSSGKLAISSGIVPTSPLPLWLILHAFASDSSPKHTLSTYSCHEISTVVIPYQLSTSGSIIHHVFDVQLSQSVAI